MKEENRNVICVCGSLISFDDIDYNNFVNEEGEDYGVVTAYCERCGKDYECSQWGEFENILDALDLLKDWINVNIKK